MKVLKSEVMSPRIAWFNFLDAIKTFTKVVLLLAVIAAAGYGIQKAIEHTFHDNPDFRLQVINLSPNDVMDEADLVAHLDMDLSANIFDFDVQLMQDALLEIPAISEAKVERELPGTLNFTIKTRQPLAWINSHAAPQDNATRRIGGLLIDQKGFTYSCPSKQFAQAQHLPVILLTEDPHHPIVAGLEFKHPQYRRCAKLLASFSATFPEDVSMIEAIYQENPWSMILQTRTGTLATFGLEEHQRQLDYFDKALQHSQKKAYEIETINLIPKQNIPITVNASEEPPRAIPVNEDDLLR